jgi:hypothetical protein
LRAIKPELVPPEWLMVAAIASVFLWGFSKRTELSPEEKKIDLLQETPTKEAEEVSEVR